VVLDKLRKGLRAEPPVVAALRAHQWSSEGQKRDLIQKFKLAPDLEIDEVVWTALDQTAEIREAGIEVLKRRPDPHAVLEALVPLLRTRSEAARRAVQRFLQEVAGDQLGPFLSQQCEEGDDFGRLAAVELAKSLPGDGAISIYKRLVRDPNLGIRRRALKALSESTLPGAAALASNMAVKLLEDEDEEIRLAALALLEKNPDEAHIGSILQLAAAGAGRIADAAFSALRRLLPLSKADHTNDILPLLASGSASVRTGALSLLERTPPDPLARAFVEQFNGSFVWVRDRALETLNRAFPTFLPALLRLTADPDRKVAGGAAELALIAPDPRALPVWMNLLDNPDWWIRSRALESLGKYGAGRDDVYQKLAGALRVPELTLSAASALGEFGDPRGLQPLGQAFQAAMAAPDEQLEILDSMAKLGAKDPRVGAYLGNVSKHPSFDERVRERARDLVGRLQGAAAMAAIPSVASSPQRLDLANVENARLVDFLADTVAKGASDFHLATGFAPHQRINGALTSLDVPGFSRERSRQLLKQVLTDEEWRRLEQDRQLDICLKVAGLGRFRANLFSQRSGFDASFRVIPHSLPTLSELGLPQSAWELTRYTQGLVLVTGPAGCGKSTTLATLLDRVNETRRGHIITVEDPVEFVHVNKESLVNQRQVPQHTKSFARALKAALREDPDVIMIGEMRDLETISLAISASETGHLVFGTLHTTTATGTIDRVINAFPAGQQGQIRAMIADSLKAVISQALLPRRGGGGRVAAFEILRGTQNVAALIREAKTHQLPSALQTGQLAGMVTMDQALIRLAEDGKVDLEAAYDRALKKEPFEKLLNEERQALA